MPLLRAALQELIFLQVCLHGTCFHPAWFIADDRTALCLVWRGLVISCRDRAVMGEEKMTENEAS